jgi:predicted Zn-dependent peptidase
MIDYDKFTLENGLRVLVHRDATTPIVSVNILYDVGSKDEDPNMTGFAHLFEHLMFGGSVNIPLFDEPLEKASGENNAFTSNDLTNYYITLPKENIETAFWLESDRMLSLAFTQKSLDIQKSVVVEEFNQRYLNQPYGDVWLLLRPLAYKVHPYQWPTIGKDPQHIINARLDDVKNFFFNHYAPNNAILCVTGDITTQQVRELCEKWFGPIPHRNLKPRCIQKEPLQNDIRVMEVVRHVPFDSIYMVFHMFSRSHPDFSTTDLISDLLSNGKSSRLYQSLVKDKELFSNIDAYITGDVDEGLFVIAGRLNDGVQFNNAQSAIFNELDKLKFKAIDSNEVEKVKNRFESNFTFGLTSSLEKAINLCFYELLGDANMLNHVVSQYRSVTVDDIKRVSSNLFKPENSTTLLYKADKV